MAEDDILDYLRKKQEFIDDDYKLRVIFDFVFFDGNKITYDDISKQLDLKMTIAPITNPYKMKIFLNTNKFKNATRECKINNSYEDQISSDIQQWISYLLF